MSREYEAAAEQIRDRVLDPDALVRAVASGRRRDGDPGWRRVEMRYVDLKAGRHLQIVAYDQTQAHTSNHAVGAEARRAVDELLGRPFGNWHVETVRDTVQLRITKKLKPLLHIAAVRADAGAAAPEHAHDRAKQRLLPADDPVFAALGLTDAQGRLKPSRQAKYRQVEEFLRLLDTALLDAIAKGRVREPSAADPLRIVDLGCGNAYLTFAAQRFLSTVRGLPVVVTGVDVKEQSREHNAEVAARLGVAAEFVVGTIGGVSLPQPPDVVLALHACDTATDEALAQVIGWQAPLALVAPCCHHDVSAQLRRNDPPEPYAELVRHGILRERLADTLTDAVRSLLLRSEGYQVTVVQFVESRHTPRNTMLRAVRTSDPVQRDEQARAEYDDLVRAWQIKPALAELIAP